MFKKPLLVLLTLWCFVLVSGCYGKVEINELAIASALGIDKTENGYKISAQVIRVKSIAGVEEGVSGTNVVVYSEEGKTIHEALRKLSNYYQNIVFIGHVQLVVFGEELAREGMKEPLDFLYESPLTRQRFLIAIVHEKTAEDLLKIQTPLISNPAAEINASIEASSENLGNSTIVYADDLIASFLTKEYNFTLTGLKIMGNPQEGMENKNLETTDISTYIKTDGLAVLQDEKLVGWLTIKESTAFNHLMGLIKRSILSITFNEQLTSVELVLTKMKSNIELKNEKISVTYDYQVEGIILGDPKHWVYSKKDIKAAEDAIASVLKEDMDLAIQKIQKEFKSDVFGIGEKIRDKYPYYWKKIEKEYNELFPTIDIKVNVKARIINQTI